jgi:hypothetical protein
VFAIGADEKLNFRSSQVLRRHSIVWLGDAAGEESRGIPGSHPLCAAILRVLAHYNFVGAWITCQETASLREFERKVRLSQLARAQWVVDPATERVIRAHRVVSRDAPWPFFTEPALPWPQAEILMAGGHLDYTRVDCQQDGAPHRSVRSEDLLDRPQIVQWLVATGAVAVCIGRTQTDNSPGISLIGAAELQPEAFVDATEVLAVHRGDEAARAWAYARIKSTPT